MSKHFRTSMGWLHTWAGVVLGGILFAVFWMGTLSVFDREIDRWMMPVTRIAPAPVPVPISLDRDIRPILESRAPNASAWTILMPSARNPVITLMYGDDQQRKHTRLQLDPQTFKELADPQTSGASRFIYPFHHNLTVRYKHWGAWLVGFASMAMLCLLISGIVIHRKILQEFFTFRSKKNFQRATLDLHNMTGVLALPFHLLITLSGLIVAFSIYFPYAHEALYPEVDKGNVARVDMHAAQASTPGAAPDGDARAQRRAARAAARRAGVAGESLRPERPERAFARESLGQTRRVRANAPGTLGSLDAMVASAQEIWKGQKVTLIRVNNLNDAKAYVVLRHATDSTVTKQIDNIHFDAASGKLMSRFDSSPMVNIWNFISGMHYTSFEHWLLRWLYFVAGLSGCVMIATGFLFWLDARRASHAKQALAGVPVVEAMTIGSVSGIILATLAFFVVNRILPLDVSVWGVERAQLEKMTFFLVWGGAFIHAIWHSARRTAFSRHHAWREQSWAIAGLAIGAVGLNAVSTGDHLLKTVGNAYWPVAGMDLVLLLGAGLALLSAHRLGKAIPPRERNRVPDAALAQATRQVGMSDV